MASQSIPQEMMRYFMQLNDAEQESILQMIKIFLKGRNEDIKPVTLDEYNRELEQNDAEIEAGEYVSHEEVMKRYLKS